MSVDISVHKDVGISHETVHSNAADAFFPASRFLRRTQISIGGAFVDANPSTVSALKRQRACLAPFRVSDQPLSGLPRNAEKSPLFQGQMNDLIECLFRLGG